MWAYQWIDSLDSLISIDVASIDRYDVDITVDLYDVDFTDDRYDHTDITDGPSDLPTILHDRYTSKWVSGDSAFPPSCKRTPITSKLDYESHDSQ